MAGTQQNASAIDTAISEVEHEFVTMYSHTRSVLGKRAVAVHPDLPIFGFKLMRTLLADGELQQGCLAESLHADKAVVSRTVRQLVDLGLVERTADPTDGRAQLVALTPTGRERLETVAADNRSLLRERLDTWDVDEIRRLRDLISKINESLDS